MSFGLPWWELPPEAPSFPTVDTCRVSFHYTRALAHGLHAVVRLSEGCANPGLRFQETQAEVVLAEEGQ